MGIFRVPAKVYRGFPGTDGAPAEVELLVDTGATFSVLPRDLLTRTGVKAVQQRQILTIDRKLLKRDLGYVGIEVAGCQVWSPVLFGEPEDHAVLGAVTMEIAGLIVDPERKELLPRPALLL
jgi:predicted aspartyl protease